MKQYKILSYIFVCLMLFASMAFSVDAGQSAVDLRTAGNFVILAKSGISTTGTTSIVGNIGVSPIDSTAITGFGLIRDSSNEYATSSIVNGKIYAADYTVPSPAKMTAAVSDMQTAYTDAKGRSNPTATELGAGNIDGMTLSPGLYRWGTGVEISKGVTLSGDADDVWIFQIAKDLTVGNGAIITLSDGAQAKNIFWQVAGQTTLGTTSDFKGIILSKTAIALNTGAKLNGRALAQTAVTLDASTVIAPTVSAISTPATNPTTPTSTTTSTASTPTSTTTSTASTPTSTTTSTASTSTSTTTSTASTPTNPTPTATQTSDTSSRSSETSDESQSRSSDWECAGWSSCSPEGVRTMICTQQDNQDRLTKRESCAQINQDSATQTTAQIAVQRASQTAAWTEKYAALERKEELRSGDYTSSLGQQLRVRALAHDMIELRVNGVAAQTDLDLTSETDPQGKTRFSAKLRNGQETEIKIMPDTASEKALEMLRVNVCSEDNNCTIQLKDVGSGATEKIQYEVQLERHSRIFGIFQKKMLVRADVDAQTGETRVHKPWWAFLATEPSE